MPKYFFANADINGFNYQLFETDGTDGAGTRQVTTGGPGLGSFPSYLINSGARSYFTAYDAGGNNNVYATDGTSVTRLDTGTATPSYTAVTQLAPYTAANGTNGVLFIGSSPSAAATRYQLYSSNGTAAGTKALGSPGTDLPGYFVQSGNLTYFTAQDFRTGAEVWATDGTSLIELDPNPSSLSPSYQTPTFLTAFTEAGGTKALAFVADTNMTAGGAPQYKVFVTTGTAGAGTVAVTGSFPQQPGSIIASGAHVFFTAKTAAGTSNLWSLDGKNAAIALSVGTGTGFDNIYGVTSYADGGTDKVVFAGRTAAGYQIVVSDGTAAGTTAFPKTFINQPTPFSVGGGQPYFTVYDGTGEEVWAVGATGPVQLDPASGTPTTDTYVTSSSLTPFTRADGSQVIAFFGKLNPALGGKYQLYISNGTPGAGTVAVGSPFSTAPGQTTVGGTSVFLLAADAAGNQAVYATDGKSSLVKLDPAANASYTGARDVTAFTRADGKQAVAFFANANLTGAPNYRLYVSDGTAAGTAAVTTGGANFTNLQASGSTLYFTETDSNGQTELWSYNGVKSTKLDPNPQGATDSYTSAYAPVVTGFALSALNARQAEGQSGTTPFTFTVSRSGNSASGATLDYTVAGSGASPADAADFGGTSPRGSVTFLPGETLKTISVGIVGDSAPEPDEAFTVSLSAGAHVAASAITTATASGTILNDDNASPIVGYKNETTGQSGIAHLNPSDAGGPSYLQWQYIFGGNDTLAISTEADNVFIHGGNGTDAIQVHGGTNVIDGGLGSNFLTGGSGTDTFFTDARAPGAVWNTIRNFHTGDAATLWGFQNGVSSYYWEDHVDGAPGSQGATLRANIVGGTGRVGDGIDASITFAGLTVEQGKALAHSTGTQPAGSYLYFAAT